MGSSSTSRDARDGSGAGKAGSAGIEQPGAEDSATGSTASSNAGVGAATGSGPAPGLESLGMVAGDETDASRLLNETDAALRDAPPELSEQLEAGFEQQTAHLTSWAQLTDDGIDIASVCLLPQWHLTDKERQRLSERLSRMLDLLCPVKMSPVIEAVVGVALTCGGICASRAITNGGRLPPLGPAREPTQEPAHRDPMTVTSLTE